MEKNLTMKLATYEDGLRDGAVLNMVLRTFLRVTAQSLQDHCAGSDHWTSRKRVLAGVSLRCVTANEASSKQARNT